MYVAFDLLAEDDRSLLELPFSSGARRSRSCLAGKQFADAPIELMATARDAPSRPKRWLQSAEGAIAKERSAPYLPGERKGMVKIKRVRTIDAVVVGWRPGKEEGTVGALILGLYDGGELRVVGHCSGLSRDREAAAGGLPRRLRVRRARLGRSRAAGARARTCEWVGLRPELVVEIDFDHVSRRAHPPRREAAPLARGQGRRASAPSTSCDS